jgi:hypothetical protein
MTGRLPSRRLPENSHPLKHSAFIRGYSRRRFAVQSRQMSVRPVLIKDIEVLASFSYLIIFCAETKGASISKPFFIGVHWRRRSAVHFWE